MREILFRGKRADNGEWVEGYFFYKRNKYEGDKEYAFECAVITPGVELTRGAYGETSKLIEWEVIPESVSEFSGLCDKNGKKIFEGDVVKGMFRFGSPVKAVIKFQDGAFGLAWFRGSVQFDAFTSICNVTFEVIGNIHDNPELLKGETK